MIYFFPNAEVSLPLVFTPEGQPPPAAERAAPLRPVSQADSSSVSGPARAASPGRQCQLATWFLGDYVGDEWARQKEDSWQVPAPR